MRGTRLIGYEKSYRGTIDSAQLSQDFQNIYDDLAEAYLRNKYNASRLKMYNEVRYYQDQQYCVKIGLVSSQLTTTNTNYAAAGGKMMYWSAYDSNHIQSNSNLHDQLTGSITLPWAHSWTKLPIVTNEYGDRKVSSLASIETSIDGGTTWSNVSSDNPVYRCLDGNPGTVWLVEYTTGSAPSTYMLRVSLPHSTNPAISSIYTAPFPDYGTTITNIRYLSRANSWTQVEDFASSNTKARYHFTPVDYNNQVELTYVSSTYSIRPSITESRLATDDRPVVIEIYEDAGLSTLLYSNLVHGHTYSGSIATSGAISTVYLKLTLRKVNSTTPVFNDITLRYN